MFGKSHSPAQMYNQIHLDTGVSQADPHRLIMMLFDGADKLFIAADSAMQSGDIAAKGEAISRAIRIIDEGLRAVLDPQGGEIADNLRLLYDYMLNQLLLANLRNDRTILGEVRSLLKEVNDGWSSIAPGANNVRQAGRIGAAS